MLKYVKKPIVIEAIQYKDSVIEIFAFFNQDKNLNIPIKQDNYCIIRTLEGDMRCNSGDYIIRGIKGEFYPCKSDIFEQSYEKIHDA